MPSPTLKSMAQRACARNIMGLQDVGDMAYELVRPILKQVDNPQQLRNIEIASPQIADHDAELWRAFIARDVLHWEEKIVEPKNPHSWWKVYRKLTREEQRAKEEQEAQLKASLMGYTKQKEANQTQYIPKVVQEDVRNKAFVFGVRNPRANSSGQIRTPGLQNAKTGDQVLRAIRKESAAANKHRGLSKMVLQPAKDMLPSAKSQISHAPAAMIRDYAKPAPSPLAKTDEREARPAPRLLVSRQAPTAQQKSLSNALREEQAKKEDRLRALTGSGPKASTATPPSSSSSAPRPMVASSQSPPTASARPPPRPTTPVQFVSPRAGLAGATETKRRYSPSPTPPVVRKRPAQPPSVFMPSKKKKI